MLSGRLLALLSGAVLLAWAASGAFADGAHAATACRYALRAAALTDPTATEVSLQIRPSAPTCKTPNRLRSVRIKVNSSTGRLRSVRTLRSVPSPKGAATVSLKGLVRRERLRITLSFRNLGALAIVRLRPDLVVAAVAPATSVAAATPSTIAATVSERNRDTGTTAQVLAFAGTSPVGTSSPIRVRPGRRIRVQLQVTLPAAGQYGLVLRVTDTTGRERATTDDEAQLTVEATDFAVDPAQVLVPSLAGYGAQLNQNVYAAISQQVGVNAQNVADMEAKLVALQPGFVRMFFNGNAYSDPDLMQSFVRTVQLAQRAGATINVTWAGGGESTPDTTMARFAGVLVDLVKNRGVTNLRWVTIENEPNRTRITLDQYDALYRALDKDLVDAGIRKQVRFMGGDLVEAPSPLGQTQTDWLTYLGTHMADLLDAYSIHVFWDYWDTGKLVRRLTQVRQIVDSLPADARRPLYATEFSPRGIRALNGVSYPEPGVLADGTPLAQTTINAFQHAWFDVLAARLGYAGTSKWDGYPGKYDRGTQDYSLLGPPQQGWPLRPVYYATRLFTSTTRPGWKVVSVVGSSGTKLLAGYTGPRGQTTVVGLDTSGASLAAPSTTTDSYGIGGLPANTDFQVVVWNPDGSGLIAPAAVVRTDAAGVLNVAAPLQSVFAATTLVS
jgi:hypothetical protein